MDLNHRSRPYESHEDSHSSIPPMSNNIQAGSAGIEPASFRVNSAAQFTMIANCHRVPAIRDQYSNQLSYERICGTPENRTLFHSLKGYCMTGMLVSQGGEDKSRRTNFVRTRNGVTRARFRNELPCHIATSPQLRRLAGSNRVLPCFRRMY